jgi:starvation-inducible outer membrane lipoprotein
MRLRAGLCGLLLMILAGCETIPESVKIEIDDRLIELKRKPVSPPAPAPVPAPAPAPAEEPDAAPER